MSQHEIVRIIARLNIGGPAINATLLASGLNHGAFCTTLVAGHVGAGEGDMSYLATAAGIQPHYISELGPALGLGSDGRALVRLLALLRARRPTIVHTHTAKAGALGRAAAILCRTPVVVHTYHGHVFRGYFTERKARAFLRIERALAQRSSALIAVSERVADELASEFAVARRDRIRVIPLGFDLDPFLSARASGAMLRRELGVDTAAPLIGIIGRMVPIKNQALFLEAAARLRRIRPDARFVLVGDGPLRRDLEQLTEQLGLRDCAHFLGWRQDMVHVYGALDVVVLTSRNEGTPVALIEAQAAGLPVVATNVGGVADCVVEGETGHLVAQSAAAVAERLESALSDRDLQNSAREIGPDFVRGRFGKERLLLETAALYDELIAAAR